MKLKSLLLITTIVSNGFFLLDSTALISHSNPSPNPNDPIYLESYRSTMKDRRAIISPEPSGRMPVTVKLQNFVAGDICIFEVLRKTNGTGPDRPDDPSSPAAQDPAHLPEPFIGEPNPDDWRVAYKELTGYYPPAIIDGIKIEGSIVATWGSKNNKCKTNYPKYQEDPGGFQSNQDYFYFIDYHGTMKVTRPTPRMPYKIGGGFNVRQYYLWYRIGQEDKVHIFTGPFFIRRWVWGVEERECSGFFGGTGDLAYYMNVAKYDWNGSLISEKKLTPGLGCGGPIEKVSP